MTVEKKLVITGRNSGQGDHNNTADIVYFQSQIKQIYMNRNKFPKEKYAMMFITNFLRNETISSVTPTLVPKMFTIYYSLDLTLTVMFKLRISIGRHW